MKHIKTHALPGISRQQLRAADTSAAASTSAPRGRVAITIAVMLSISLSALDLTIVSTAMPTIASELGGFAFYSWVFSAYLLTSTSMVPIFGRLADKLGRRHAFVSLLGYK